jgi:hypothetical protein
VGSILVVFAVGLKNAVQFKELNKSSTGTDGSHSFFGRQDSNRACDVLPRKPRRYTELYIKL